MTSILIWYKIAVIGESGEERNGEVVFLIEVEGVEPDGDFTIRDLKMFHQECYGGIIMTEGRAPIHLRCRRCPQELLFYYGEEIHIIKTAVDGERRVYQSFEVVQKDQKKS